MVVLSNNDGCVIARSEESKALGIMMGDVFYQVKDVLEKNGVAVFSSNYNLYGDMSRRVMSLLSTYTPKLDIYSIDEAFLDLTGMGDIEFLSSYCKQMVRDITKGTGIPISLGVAPTKTLAKMASKYADRIHFLHLRNIKYDGDRCFEEVGHPTECGSIDMFGIVKALVDKDWDGYVRPDHGRMIWGETGKPGYGLFDRALGATYINGLFEALEKEKSK